MPASANWPSGHSFRYATTADGGAKAKCRCAVQWTSILLSDMSLILVPDATHKDKILNKAYSIA